MHSRIIVKLFLAATAVITMLVVGKVLKALRLRRVIRAAPDELKKGSAKVSLSFYEQR